MKHSLPAFLIVAFVLVYCSGNKNNPDKKSESGKTDLQMLHLPESGEDTLKTSYFADTVVYIPLETTRESIINSIAQLWMNDSVMLINNLGGGLLMFRQDGKFIKQIGKTGRGPGEYGNIYHFDVIRDTVYISSTVNRGFLRYTLDGDFCDEIKLNYAPVYFSSTSDRKLAVYNREEGEIYVYNKGLRISPDTITVEYGVTLGRYKYSQYLGAGINHLQKTQSGLIFNSFLSDTIWNITSGKKEPDFFLKMKDKLLPYDRQIEFSNGDFEWFQKMASPFCFVHVMPFPSLMLIFQLHHTIMADDSGYDAIYLSNTATGTVKKFQTNYIYDDLVSKQNLSNERLNYFYPINLSDYLVTSKKTSDVMKYLEKSKGDKKTVPSLLWLNQMKSIKENDNPMLVKIKIKKHLP